jgi:hypothetical protein
MGYSICVFAKENDFIVKTWPPYSSNASQQLDKTNYGPFKCHLAKNHANWMREHYGQRVSIYEVPLLSKPAILRAFTETNIKKGFQGTGIFPLNSNAISNSMFAASIVTYLPGMRVIKLSILFKNYIFSLPFFSYCLFSKCLAQLWFNAFINHSSLTYSRLNLIWSCIK